MKILRLKNFKRNPDAERIVAECVRTAEGLEVARINMETGEITYAEGCGPEDEDALRLALAQKGIETEKG